MTVPAPIIIASITDVPLTTAPVTNDVPLMASNISEIMSNDANKCFVVTSESILATRVVDGNPKPNRRCSPRFGWWVPELGGRHFFKKKITGALYHLKIKQQYIMQSKRTPPHK